MGSSREASAWKLQALLLRASLYSSADFSLLVEVVAPRENHAFHLKISRKTHHQPKNGKPKTKTKKIIKKQKTQVNTETDNGIHGFHNLWLSNIPGVVTNQWNDNCDLKLLETTTR